MLRRYLGGLVSCCCVWLAVSGLCVDVVQAADEQPSAATKELSTPIRVLVTYGGHDFEEAEFWEMFDSMPGIKYDRAELPAAFDRFTPELADQYDVMVRFDMLDGMTDEQRQAYVKLLRDRGMGLVSLHHNLASHRDWNTYREIIGGSYLFEPVTINGREYEVSTYHHWDRTEYRPVKSNHPITKGIGSFVEIGGGETYGRCYVADDAARAGEDRSTGNDAGADVGQVVREQPGGLPDAWPWPAKLETARIPGNLATGHPVGEGSTLVLRQGGDPGASAWIDWCRSLASAESPASGPLDSDRSPSGPLGRLPVGQAPMGQASSLPHTLGFQPAGPSATKTSRHSFPVD